MCVARNPPRINSARPFLCPYVSAVYAVVYKLVGHAIRLAATDANVHDVIRVNIGELAGGSRDIKRRQPRLRENYNFFNEI